MDYVKVVGYDNLVRDTRTGAIINTDKDVFDEAKKRKFGASSLKQIQTDVEDLKNELSDIKNLLREFIRNASNT